MASDGDLDEAKIRISLELEMLEASLMVSLPPSLNFSPLHCDLTSLWSVLEGHTTRAGGESSKFGFHSSLCPPENTNRR
jgi:hypothetical protein